MVIWLGSSVVVFARSAIDPWIKPWSNHNFSPVTNGSQHIKNTVERWFSLYVLCGRIYEICVSPGRVKNCGSNPGSFADCANTLPLSYRATRSYHQQLITCYKMCSLETNTLICFNRCIHLRALPTCFFLKIDYTLTCKLKVQHLETFIIGNIYYC
mgnify:CR=1 FL=1